VQSVLQAALKYRAVDHFDGYQENAAIVRKQVFALWNVFQRAHVHYSSTTTASAASPKGKVFSQSVRFIDETIREQQANCVDGSVLFASVLYKIGIDPVLVLLPGHMFVGYYVDRQHRRIEFLETTLLGHGHQPSQYNLAFSPVLHPVETSESYRQFMTALQYANQEYQQKVAPHLADGGMQYQLIDIRKAREQGINAIPRP